MDNIAICYDNIIIHWNSLLILLALISGFIMTIFFYVGRAKLNKALIVFYPVAVCLSIVLSRFIHWYCNMEQYEGFITAMTDYSTGGYCISGILFAVLILVKLFYVSGIIKQTDLLLDSLAPALCFILSIIRLSDYFTSVCIGKYTIKSAAFCRLPFACIAPDGNYHMASYYISFLLLLILFIVLSFISISSKKLEKGLIFRLFLLFFGAFEIFIDSTRYDASHLFFPGKIMEPVNKGAGFIGLSQIVGAFLCLYFLIYYTKKYRKKNKNVKFVKIMWIIFFVGVIIGGVCEYAVQRMADTFVICYTFQLIGIITLIVSCLYTRKKTK